MKLPPRILVFSPSTRGGIAEHTFYQANALEHAGAKVTCLVAPSFPSGRPARFERLTCLSDPPQTMSSQFLKHIRMAWRLIANRLVLAREICKRRPNLVLLDSYVEYLAPLWIWPHWILAKLGGVRYAANLHDPVRNHVVGPGWWHKLSVRLAYLPLDFVLVHEQLPNPSPVPTRVRVTQVPHGLYEICDSTSNRDAVRLRWGIRDGQKVFLSFGFVRDGKNIDLAIRALAQVHQAVLVMAGSLASPKDKSFAFYRELAANLGVADRCRFFEGFVADKDLGEYFAGTDFVLLTYSSSFHSQSGVLNIAARARKVVLASASPSALIQSVKKFALGIAVAPDSSEAIADGMRRLIECPSQPRWDEYEAFSGWESNARGILQAAGYADV